ncbi:hypothetical protein TcasGA2_TC016268 [Tribolium castaneum]|uniref:Uncharacterized protein n=1 Tax=Tribolium castaneum TaxID=7070 RepID=D6X2W7_TRICA|nr:hypothetical protein TcasGA2_TC016268 [Tribolium castaneum]
MARNTDERCLKTRSQPQKNKTMGKGTFFLSGRRVAVCGKCGEEIGSTGGTVNADERKLSKQFRSCHCFFRINVEDATPHLLIQKFVGDVIEISDGLITRPVTTFFLN